MQQAGSEVTDKDRKFQVRQEVERKTSWILERDHLTGRMEEERGVLTESILDLTLEIIHLLTGEAFPPVKSGDHVTITVPSRSLVCKKNKKQKVLKVINKMIDLLTGEVPLRYQDSGVDLSMEERKFLEGHKELYKAAMMEDQPMGRTLKRNLPERYPRPLYYQDSDQEGEREDQFENWSVKVEVVEEDEDDDPCAARYRHCKEEETPREISKAGGRDIKNHSDESFISSLNGKAEDDDVAWDFPTENPATPDIHPGLDNIGSPADASDAEGFAADQLDDITQTLFLEGIFPCSICGRRFSSRDGVIKHEALHNMDKPFSYAECGKSFTRKAILKNHQKVHRADKPFACPQCGKCFNKKSNLARHQAIHRGEKPYSCSHCWKCFSQKSKLVYHLRSQVCEKKLSVRQ